ncbi:hypothetical protein NQ318_013666 [Aromia moschata]|uniref:Uncharacterized protein n=1 Tax=Aromia moschata TaxID=1265417 RepID=A0AAV8XYS7_9CUCU|nr:hypothetical protein NQ318_013666 [Aromia moschata]
MLIRVSDKQNYSTPFSQCFLSIDQKFIDHPWAAVFVKRSLVVPGLRIVKSMRRIFLECFKLATPRQGEICNACVLLVKRWKKLPAGSDRNWQHVVDARAGPGIKSVMKCKSKHKKRLCRKPEAMKKKHFDREYSPAFSDKSEGNEEMELAEADFFSEGGPSAGSSRTASPGASDCEDGADKGEKDKMSEESGGGQHQISDFVRHALLEEVSLAC